MSLFAANAPHMPLTMQERESDSPYIARVWQGHTIGETHMTSVATSTWEIVFWHVNGQPHATIRGPETCASAPPVYDDSVSLGITFTHATSMPHLITRHLVDSEVHSPHATRRSFILRDQPWETPTFESAEQFVNHLMTQEVLTFDPLVRDVLHGEEVKIGTRSIQRRIASHTGLTRAQIHQIERARVAAHLIKDGASPLRVAHRLGYYDQPHLARSLRRFIGRSATEIQNPNPDEMMSFLYKTQH